MNDKADGLMENRLPGDTAREDWSGRRYTFFAVVDPHTGKQTGLAREGRTRARERYVYCPEHKDFEVSRRRITPKEALRYAGRKEGAE